MANKKITELTEETSPAGADLLPLVDDVAGTPTTKKVTVTNLMTLAPVQTADIANFSSAFYSTVSETTTARTLSDSDNGKIIVCNNANEITVSLPNGLTSGFNCTLVQSGVGNVRVAVTGTATLYGYTNFNGTAGQYASINIQPIGTDTYIVTGEGQAISPPGANELQYDSGLFFDTGGTYYISTDPVMHFDAAILDGSSSSNNPSSGSSVTTWGDRSGNSTNYDATQSDANKKPTYTVSGDDKYVSFDGGDLLEFASYTLPTAFNMVVVCNTNADANHLLPVGANASSQYVLFEFNGRTYGLFTNGVDNTYGPNYNSIQQFWVTRDSGNNNNIYVQGGNSILSGNSSISRTVYRIGSMNANLYHTGPIYEIIIWGSDLSTSEKNTVRNYLNNKYSSLPTSTAFA